MLADVVRNGVVESIHHGVAVTVGADGRVGATVGHPDTAIYPRSSLKPLQASAMVDLGLDIPDRLLAVVAASHSGETEHLAAVREILDLHGLTVDDLANTPTRPYGAVARAEARLAGIAPSSLQQNCSGKHAGMLATCTVNGWPTTGYLDADHPLQRLIVARFGTLGAPVAHVGVDGCGAPTHVLGLADLARAFGRLVLDEHSVARAMSAHPFMLGGTDRDVTLWTEAVPGLVAKEGAQGVMALALHDGSAAAFKIADGSDMARRAVTVQALRELGVDVDGEHAAVRDRVGVPVLGHGEPVGALEPRPWTTA